MDCKGDWNKSIYIYTEYWNKSIYIYTESGAYCLGKPWGWSWGTEGPLAWLRLRTRLKSSNRIDLSNGKSVRSLKFALKAFEIYWWVGQPNTDLNIRLYIWEERLRLSLSLVILLLEDEGNKLKERVRLRAGAGIGGTNGQWVGAGTSLHHIAECFKLKTRLIEIDTH